MFNVIKYNNNKEVDMTFKKKSYFLCITIKNDFLLRVIFLCVERRYADGRL